MTGSIVTTPPTVELPPGSTSGGTSVLPPYNVTYAIPSFPQTWTAKQTFPLGNITLNAADVVGLSPSSTIDTTNASNITSGTLAIARGGTGQSTQSAGFDALSPTTTRGDLIARGASSNGRLALGTSGYALMSNGTDAAWSGFLQAGTGATTRTWQDKAREAFSITDFGAVSGGSAATNSTAIAAAFSAALAAGMVVRIPAGNYSFNTGIVIAGVVPVTGEGQEQSILTYTGTGGTALSFQPSTSGTPYTGHHLRDFSIVNGGTGAIGLEVSLGTGAHYADFDWHKVKVGAFSTVSARLLNVAGNTDGFFLGSIKRCTFYNGFTGTLVGDSIDFCENQVAGTTQFKIGQVSGARQLVVSSNNITTTGGVRLDPVYGARVERNQIEILASTNYTGDTDASVYLTGSNISFLRNRVTKLAGGTAPNYTVLVDGTTDHVRIDECELGNGPVATIFGNTSTSNVVVGEHNLLEGTGVVTLSGSNSYSNAWTAYTSTFAATSGTATVAARQRTDGTNGKTIFVNIIVTLTSAVTGTFSVTLPKTAKSNSVISGKEIASLGTGAAGFVTASSNQLSVLNYAGLQYTASGNVIVLTGSYESA